MPSGRPGRGDTRRNLSLLLALRRILCTEGDLDAKLRMVANEIAQTVADYAVVDVLEGGTPRRRAICHADARFRDELDDAAARFRAGAGSRVARGLASDVVELIVPGRRGRTLPTDDDFAFLGAQAPTSWVQAPIHAEGEPFALLTFVTTKRKPFDDGALALFEEVRAWCGLFVENAVLRRASIRPPSGRRSKTAP